MYVQIYICMYCILCSYHPAPWHPARQSFRVMYVCIHIVCSLQNDFLFPVRTTPLSDVFSGNIHTHTYCLFPTE